MRLIQKPSEWTCQGFLEVDDDVKPQDVYWMEGFNKAGKLEVAAGGVDYFEAGHHGRHPVPRRSRRRTRPRLISLIFDRRLDDYDNPLASSHPRISAMSDLVCIAFKGRNTADQVLNELRSMQKEHLVDLEDACVVTRDAEGKLQSQAGGQPGRHRCAVRAAPGERLGHARRHAVHEPAGWAGDRCCRRRGRRRPVGALADYGIDDEFIKSLGEQIGPDYLGAVRAATQGDVRQGAAGTRQVRRQGDEDVVCPTNRSGRLRDALSRHAAPPEPRPGEPASPFAELPAPSWTLEPMSARVAS